MNTTAHRPTALITGAAKRVGAEIARHLAASGWDLVLHYHRSQAEAEALAAELAAAHGTASTLRAADFTRPESLAGFWQGLPATTLLVLNAATYGRDTLPDLNPAKLREQLTVNFESPLLLAQGFFTQLPEGAQGNAVVLGDATMTAPVAPKYFSYAVSKHAWFSAITVLAAAMAPRARANLLALGPTLPNPGEEAMFDRLAARAPLKRVGAPSDICAAIDFLLASPGVTGQVISLANGIGLAPTPPAG